MGITTFHHPILSAAQAALHQALSRLDEPGTEHLSTGHPLMQQLIAAGAQSTGQPPSGNPETGPVIDQCAKMFLDYVKARAEGHDALAQDLSEQIRFSNCDVGWSQSILAYEEFVHFGGRIPYVALAPGEGVLPLPVQPTVSIGLVADWGTGTPESVNLLRQIQAVGSPDLLVHLGDIYYAGTEAEVQQNFVSAVRQVYPTAFTPGGFPVYNLAGNHDMYAGGAGYYGLLQSSGQPASYFCLQNADWQVVCLDTGYNDRDPFTVLTNITSLPDDQAAWAVNLVQGRGSRGTILLSHHQLYSGAGDVGASKAGSETTRWGINPSLYRQLQPVLGAVSVWIWGHEHNTVIFEPTPGLPPGRCIGSGAVPMLLDEHPYVQDATLSGVNDLPVPKMDPSVQLGNNGEEYNHGFAVLTLSGARATVTYYQVPLPTPADPAPQAQKLFTETFAPAPAPRAAAAGGEGALAAV